MSSVLQAIEVAPEWHENVEKNIKKITIRLGKRDYKKERTILCCPKTSWCTQRNVTEVTHSTLKEVSDAVAQEDGFKDNADLKSKLNEYYPDVSDDSEMTIVRWEEM
jgi:hypothetical protein